MASVDVAIPCYQYGHCLRRSVESVLSQGIDAVRVLVIDNASTDDSVEVAQELAAEDSRVEVVAHRRNRGAHASFNDGIDWAAADYFMVLCADDLLAPGSLVRATAIMDSHPEVGLAYGRAASVVFDDPVPELPGTDRAAADPVDGEQAGDWRVLTGRALLERFCRTGVCHIAGPTALVRTTTQKEVGYYRPALPHTDDFELWMRFARLASAAETDAVQGISSVHASNRSAFVRREHTWDLIHCAAAFDSFFAHEGAALPDADRLRRTARDSLAARAYWSALSHLCRGRVSTGVELMKLALRQRPATAVVPPLGYLLHRDDALRRLGSVLAQAVRRPGAAIGG